MKTSLQPARPGTARSSGLTSGWKAALAAVLALSGTCSAAETPSKNEKAEKAPVVSARSATAPGMVYLVEGPAGRCYLAGSIHFLSEEDGKNWPPALRIAYRECGRLVFEADPEDMRSGKTWKAFEAWGRLPKGKNLWSILTKETRQTLDAEVTDRKVRDRIAGMRPWLAALSLYQTSAGDEGLSRECGLESILQAQGAKDRKKLSGLDTPADHARSFASVGTAGQDRFLRGVCAGLHSTGGDIRRLAAWWRAGDGASLAASLESGYSGLPELKAQLIDRRNERWLPVIASSLTPEQPPLFVVGCLHLVGDRHGLVPSLERMGFKVSPVAVPSLDRPPVVSAIAAAAASTPSQPVAPPVTRRAGAAPVKQ